MQAVVPAIASLGGTHAGGNREQYGYQQRCQGQLQRVWIALGDESADVLVETQRRAEIAVQHAFPVIDILLAERDIEAVGVAGGLDIGRRRAFSQHLQDGIAGDQVDQQKDQRDHEPDYRQRVQHA